MDENEVLSLLKEIANDASAFRVEINQRLDRIENDGIETNDRLDRIENDVAQLSSDVAQLKSDVTELKTMGARLEKKIDRVEQQGAAIGYELKDEVKRANGRINQFEPELLTARVESSKNRNDIEDLKERVAALESKRAA